MRNVVLTFFFLTGASALAYELVWTRQIGVLLGNTTYVISMVLAAFMGGLAAGSLLCGSTKRNWPNGFRSGRCGRISSGLPSMNGLYWQLCVLRQPRACNAQCGTTYPTSTTTAASSSFRHWRSRRARLTPMQNGLTDAT